MVSVQGKFLPDILIFFLLFLYSFSLPLSLSPSLPISPSLSFPLSSSLSLSPIYLYLTLSPPSLLPLSLSTVSETELATSCCSLLPPRILVPFLEQGLGAHLSFPLTSAVSTPLSVTAALVVVAVMCVCVCVARILYLHGNLKTGGKRPPTLHWLCKGTLPSSCTWREAELNHLQVLLELSSVNPAMVYTAARMMECHWHLAPVPL